MKFSCPDCGSMLYVFKQVGLAHPVNPITGIVGSMEYKSIDSVWLRCDNSCGFLVEDMEENPRSIRKYMPKDA